MIDSFSGEHRFLSNFWPAPVMLDDKQYPTVEHAYQASKTLNLDDRAIILRMRNAGVAKKMGNIFALRSDWGTLRVSIMRDLLVQKFSDPVLRYMLMATRPHELVEGNSWGDTFWGVYKGVGENHLGRLLMEIRDQYP